MILSPSLPLFRSFFLSLFFLLSLSLKFLNMPRDKIILSILIYGTWDKIVVSLSIKISVIGAKTTKVF